ncbi:MAG: 3-oxoacyl-[acyl-carrier-protein] reductase [Gemmatimonadetes bacterium]|nr:3-oxoacyl-[acyl-carrier-protein] reductase [Gemmatimonadota bacterium]
MTIDLEGKVALVTGASRGIGRDIAARFVEAGAKVALVARNRDALQDTASDLGDKAFPFVADVADSESIRETVSAVEQDIGPIDILVNNAGVTRDGVLVRVSEEDWDRVLDTNLKGAFNTTKVVARGMMKRRWGRVINITSVVGVIGNRGQVNYAASKAGLIGFTKSIAKELASRNILANAIAPGFMDTNMTRDLSDEQRDALLSQIPLGKLGTGDDVASVALFLASEMASYITGQVLVVDGGMVM